MASFLVCRASRSHSVLRSCFSKSRSGALCSTVVAHGEGSSPYSVASISREGAAQGQKLDQKFTLDLDTINPHLKLVRYAVRGPVLDRAMEIEEELSQVSRKPTANNR